MIFFLVFLSGTSVCLSAIVVLSSNSSSNKKVVLFVHSIRSTVFNDNLSSSLLKLQIKSNRGLKKGKVSNISQNKLFF